MKPCRVFLWSKQSLYERFLAHRVQSERLLESRDITDRFTARVLPAHEETVRSRLVVSSVLRSAGCVVTQPQRLHRVPDGQYDLIVVVGGDGTVLDVARCVNQTPILAVNSSPSTSVGYFCRTTAEGFEAVLEPVMRGEEKPLRLTRIRIVVDGRTHPDWALNDVLVANRVPAATSRYFLFLHSAVEDQKSSGVWVSTAAGSSGAVRSAGGEPMEMDDERLQFVVREPFCQATPGDAPYRLLRGLVGQEGISFESLMFDGGLFLDGRRVAVPFSYGSVATLTPDAPPLHIFLPEGRGQSRPQAILAKSSRKQRRG